MKTLLILILSIASSYASACRPIYIPLEERVASADYVFVGLVTGKELVGFENLNTPEVLNQPYEGNEEHRISLNEHPIYKVIPYSPMKGAMDKSIYVKSINGCYGDVVDLGGSAVFIVKLNGDKAEAYILSSDSELDSVILEVKGALKNANKAQKKDANNKNGAS
jgi:hypothetical protein